MYMYIILLPQVFDNMVCPGLGICDIRNTCGTQAWELQGEHLAESRLAILISCLFSQSQQNLVGTLTSGLLGCYFNPNTTPFDHHMTGVGHVGA